MRQDAFDHRFLLVYQITELCLFSVSIPLSSAFVKFLFSLGILYGTMTLELGGTLSITCQKTGYSAILEFKLKVGK